MARRYDYSKLYGRIREVYKTQTDFAKDMNLSSQSINYRLTGKMDFKQGEIEKAMDLLKIKPEEVIEYFFTPKVEKNSIIEND